MEVKSKSASELKFQVVLVLDEQEAGALHDIVGYGYKAFMEVFKEKLGKACIEKHEKGCQSLFETISKEMPQHLSKFQRVRKAFQEIMLKD